MPRIPQAAKIQDEGEESLLEAHKESPPPLHALHKAMGFTATSPDVLFIS